MEGTILREGTSAKSADTICLATDASFLEDGATGLPNVDSAKPSKHAGRSFPAEMLRRAGALHYPKGPLEAARAARRERSERATSLEPLC